MSASKFSPRIILLIVADTAMIFGGIMVALYIRLGISGAAFQIEENYALEKTALATAVCLITLYIYDLYDYMVITRRREMFLRLVQSLGIAWAFLALLFYFAPPLMIGRGVSLFSVVIVLVLLLFWRVLIHSLTGHPDIGEKVLIVGSGKAAHDTAKAAWERRDAGFRIVGFVTENGHAPMEKIGQAEILGTTAELEEIIKTKSVDRIVTAVKERRGTFPTDSLLKMSLAGDVSIEECTSFFERVTGQVHLDLLHPSWLIFAGRGRETKLRFVIREAVHRTLAGIGLVMSLPIGLITAVLVKLDSQGPVFYRQERVGKNGRPFEVIKFRSMRIDAEEDGKPIWAADDDERATRVGRIIRKIRVDEIPQFWNILKGEMSFIGPRPERPHFVAELAKQIPFYEHRHLVAPGLTGWAQTKFTYGASVEDARKKLQYDLFYIKNQTLGLDLMIVFDTIKTVLFGRGGR